MAAKLGYRASVRGGGHKRQHAAAEIEPVAEPRFSRNGIPQVVFIFGLDRRRAEGGQHLEESRFARYELAKGKTRFVRRHGACMHGQRNCARK